ncbi:MAG: hypothetical protein BZ138_07065 [Methanosphaera sp. rholeuAM270]|nr:MAG: hypothetical protein BZ138_07065 [Methanosphaera sp. rholeuAM270]
MGLKSEEGASVNSWDRLVERVDSVRNSTEDVTITLDEGTFTSTGTIYWKSDNPIMLCIDGNGQSIDGNGHQVFNISGEGSLVLKNIIIKNASSYYGAIYNEGFLTVINSTFKDNTGSSGGAISAQGSLMVNNSNFMDNSAGFGGAILVFKNLNSATIVNSYFLDNTADNGGAIEVYDNFYRNEGEVFIDSNVFTNNSAMMGGALYVHHSALITNNLFINNSVKMDSGNSAGGAILLEEYVEDCTVNLINNSFSDNAVESGGFGGAVYARGYLLLNSYNDTFTNNVVESVGYGGALSVQDNALLNISHGTFKNNRATWAGAIYSETMLDVTDSEFKENSAEYGGAISSLNAKISVWNSIFKDLYANRSGGAIGIKYDDEFDTSISALTSSDEGLNLSEIIVENCEFSNVSSRYNGGAICFSDLRNYPDCIFVTMRVNNSAFTDCESEFGGAILQLNGNLTVNNTLFCGGCAIESGGAIYTSQANLDIINSSFTDYMASTDGEAVYFEKGVLSISDSVFQDNKTEGGTGSIYLYDSSMYLMDSYFNPESSVYGVFVGDCNIENTTLNDDRISLNNTDYVTATTYQGKKVELINRTYIDEIPPSYDLRDYGLVTPVKDQQLKGACTAFASIAAIESALLKQTNKEYDLSENNMYSNILKFSRYGSENLYEGMDLGETIAHALSWIGVIPEEYAEYDSIGTISKIFDTDDKIRVQDVMMIFSDTQDRDKLIKKAILNYGAAAVSINGTFDNDILNPETNSVYNPDSEDTNHVVAAVGWDDNYSRENFIITPPGDGAWILKDSHGTSKLDGGYFYMSYYDKSFMKSVDYVVSGNFLVVYIFNNTINYKTNYQTDLMGLSDFNSNNTYYSNTYTAYYNESLAAMGTYFNDSGVDYEFKIYVNGKHVLTQNGTSNYAGYKTIILDKYIPVMEGDTFKVVFKNNNVPLQFYSRQHYLKNISLVSADGENWVDVSERNGTVCLKVYTVETEDNDTNNTPSPQPKPVRPKAKHVQTHKTTHNRIINQANTYTIRLANDNTILYTGNALTLEALNRIFNMNFTNGQLLVYIDGLLVFNQTTTDDIFPVILKQLDKYLGEHEIKVVFTDSNNHTNTYVENIEI